MNNNRFYVFIQVITGALSILVTLVSLYGLLTPHNYDAETANWRVQSLGQDAFDLCVAVPILFLSGLWFRRSTFAQYTWGGTLVFLLYTFVIYCFDLHFTRLFISYCLILGVSFYGTLFFLIFQLSRKTWIQPSAGLRKTAGIYLVTIAVLFYFLWLSELIPASIANQSPASWRETGLVTNPVQVIDLSVLLPGLFLTGLLLIKQRKIALVMAPVLLAFCILMDLCIGSLVLFMKKAHLPGNADIAIIMVALALLSLFLLFQLTRKAVTASVQNELPKADQEDSNLFYTAENHYA